MNINNLRFLEQYPVFYYDEEEEYTNICCGRIPNVYTIKEYGKVNYVVKRSHVEEGEFKYVRLTPGRFSFGDIEFRFRYRTNQGYRYMNIFRGYEYLGDYQADYEDEDGYMCYCNGDDILVYRKNNMYKLVFSNGEIKTVNREDFYIDGNHYDCMYTFVDDDSCIQERYLSIE